MGNVVQFKPKKIDEKLAEKLRTKNMSPDELAADTASQLVKAVMPELINTYNEHGLRFTQDDRYFKHFQAIQILLYIHTCEQCGFDHPMMDYLDEVSEEIDRMIKTVNELREGLKKDDE